jgi:hypothetical protein
MGPPNRPAFGGYQGIGDASFFSDLFPTLDLPGLCDPKI